MPGLQVQQMKNNFDFDTIFFDLDGTLVDVSRRFHLAYDQTRRGLGLSSFSYDEFWAKYKNGNLSDDVAHDERPKFWMVFLSHFCEYEGPHIGEPIPGVIDLLKVLKARERPVSIITNRTSLPDKVEEELDRIGLAHYIDVVFSHGALGQALSEKRYNAHLFNKAPMLKKALDHLGVDPSRTAYVGDLGSDVKSAREAGLGYAFGVLSGGGSRADLEKASPDAILESAAELIDFI